MHKEMERTEEELGRRKNLIYCIKMYLLKRLSILEGGKKMNGGI